MSSYESLAASYDALTKDVAYEKRTDFVEKLFRSGKSNVHTVLDLACGTGTMTAELTRRGYELIGVDASAEMLMEAQEKTQNIPGIHPLFLQQSMLQLDLYGTVDAAICCLDSLNYLTRPSDVKETFRRLHLFIAPGGTLVFDVNGRAKCEQMINQVFLDEQENVFCVWRTDYSKRTRMLDSYVDIFTARGDGGWDRNFEEHHQRFYSVDELTQWLSEAGFSDIHAYGDCRMRRPKETEERIYFSCIRK